MNDSTDRIVKTTVLHSPLERVWQAITDSSEFGTWFGAEFDAPFIAGEIVTGRIKPTQVDPEVAKMQEPYIGVACNVRVEALEPMRRFAYRWHPYTVDNPTDFDGEPSTLVTFELEEVADGTRLTITESGFERVPVERRAQEFESNSQGWAFQVTMVEKYLVGDY